MISYIAIFIILFFGIGLITFSVFLYCTNSNKELFGITALGVFFVVISGYEFNQYRNFTDCNHDHISSVVKNEHNNTVNITFAICDGNKLINRKHLTVPLKEYVNLTTNKRQLL